MIPRACCISDFTSNMKICGNYPAAKLLTTNKKKRGVIEAKCSFTGFDEDYGHHAKTKDKKIVFCSTVVRFLSAGPNLEKDNL